jgi:hypothetical protein
MGILLLKYYKAAELKPTYKAVLQLKNSTLKRVKRLLRIIPEQQNEMGMLQF